MATVTVEIDARLLRDWPLPVPGAAADREDRGSTLVVAGGSETPGAALLAAHAALRCSRRMRRCAPAPASSRSQPARAWRAASRSRSSKHA